MAETSVLHPGIWWLALAIQNLTEGDSAYSKLGSVNASNQGMSPVGLPHPPIAGGGVIQGKGAMVVTSVSGSLPTNPSSFEYNHTLIPAILVRAL